MQASNDKAASQTTGNSVWSTNSLFMPAALQVPSLAQQQLDGMTDCNKFAGPPSAAEMMMPEPPTANDGSADTMPPHVMSLVEKVCRPSCAHSAASRILHFLPDDVSLRNGFVQDAQKVPGTCHPDESAASILMSLKGSSHAT